VGLEECNNHFHGKIVLAKGDKPLKHLDVQEAGSCLEIPWFLEGGSSWQGIL